MKYFRRFLLGLHLLFLLILYSVYLNMVIPPSQSFFPSFIAVGFFFLFIIHFILILFWVALRWKYGLTLIILSVGLYLPLQNWINLKSEAEKRPIGLKVLSYNVHYLEDIDGVNELIEEESPDVILMQEIYEKDVNKVSFTRPKNHHTAIYPYVAISSKHPILQHGEILDPTTNGHIAYADIQMPQRTIRFISAYLEPMYLDPNSLDRAFSHETFREGNEYVGSQLKHGFLKHEQQLSKLESFIRESPYAVLLGGDLNSTPNSYEYHFLSNYLTDAYRYSNKVFTPTFFVKGLPLRLDYFFVDDSLPVNQFRTLPSSSSDHYPIILEIE